MRLTKTTKAYTTLAVTLLTTSLGAGTLPAMGEPARFQRWDLPVITPAVALVDEYPGKQYPLGASLQLTRRTSTVAQRIRERDLQVRVFTLSAGQSEPDPWAVFDPCYVYLSAVIDVPGSRHDVIDLGRIDSPYWLTPVEGRVMERGRYLLVFEQTADIDPILRLDKTRKEEYFKSGLYVEIIPVRDYTQGEVDKLAREVQRMRREIEPNAKLNSANVRCYRYQVVRISDNGFDRDLALLDICDPNDQAP